MRTVFFSYVISNALCALVMIYLWTQNRGQSDAFRFWMAGYAANFLAVLLIVLRGSIPSFLSVIMGNFLVASAIFLSLVGIERYSGIRRTQVHNYLLVALYVMIHAYFTYAQPSQPARDINSSFLFLVLCAQTAWLIVQSVNERVRQAAKMIGVILFMYILVSAARIVIIMANPSGNDFFSAGASAIVLILIYQILFIGLTFGIILMVNRRLTDDLHNDMETRRRTEEKLSESEEMHRLLAENATDVIWTMDFEGRFTYVSPSVQRLRGFTVEEVLRQSLDEALTPASAAIAKAGMARVFQAMPSGAPVNIFRDELEQPCKDGSTVWTEVTISPMLNAAGQRVGLLGVTRDISARRRSDRLLQARLDLLEFSGTHPVGDVLQRTLDQVCALSGSPIAFYHFVHEDQKTLSLQAWSTRTLREFCKTDGYGMHYPIDEAGVWVDCVRTRKPVVHNDYASLPHRKGLPQGHAPVIRELVVPILRADKIVSILGVGNKPSDYTKDDEDLVAFFADVAWEVAQQKRTESALKQSEARYAITLNAVNDGLWDWHVPSGKAFFSPLYYRMLGYDDTEFVASYAIWTSLVHPDDLLHAEEELQKKVDSGESFSVELRMKMKSGRFRWMAIRGKAVEHDEQGKALRMVGTLTDISERKQAERYRSLAAEVIQTLNVSDNIQASVRSILSAIRRVTGFDAVGIRLQDGEDFPYCGQEGFETDFLLTENSLIIRDHEGCACRWSDGSIMLGCTCGLVISGKTDPTSPLFTPGGSFWTNNAHTLLEKPAEDDPRYHPRNQCMHFGYASIALVPIRGKQKIVGLLQLNDRRKDQLSMEAMMALESLANHIGEALIRKQAEDALQESEALYRTAMETTSDGITIVDHETRKYLYVNARLMNAIGRPDENLVGKVRDVHVHPDDVNLGGKYFKARKKGDPNAANYELRAFKPDGSMVVFSVRAADIIYHGRAATISFVTDITEQKRAEAALQESESKYRLLIDHSSDLIWNLTPEGIFTYLSASWERMTGYPPASLVNTSFQQIVHPDDLTVCLEYLQSMIEAKETRPGPEYRVRHADGTWHWHSANATPVLGPEGGFVSMVGVSRDITAQKQAEAKIRENETNFRTFFETIGDMIVVATTEGKILFTNEALKHKLGYEAHELAGMHILELHPADKRLEAREIFEAMLRGERESCPLPVATKSGVCVFVETRVWFGRWNNQDCVFGLIKDLSAEEEAKQRFEKLFRNNPALMALTTLPERAFTDVNDAFLRVLGYERADVVGKTATDLGLFPDEEQQKTVARRLQADQYISDQEIQVRRRDGVLLEGLFSGEVISNQGRQYFLTVMIDITRLKRAEVSLREERMRLDSIIQGTNVGTWEWNVQTGETIFNERWADMIGYSLQELAPVSIETWGKHVHPEDLAGSNALLEAHFRGELPYYECECRMRHKDGRWVWVFDRGSVAGWDGEGRPLWMYGTHQDITKRKEAEAELRAQREMALQASRAKGEFLSIMSHEIRTPLNAIIGMSDLLAETKLDEDQQNYVHTFRNAGESLLAIINNILDYSKIEAGKVDIEHLDFDLIDLLEKVSSILALQAHKKHLELVVDIHSDVPPVVIGDAERLRQVLMNLIGNAIKFTGQGEVRVLLQAAQEASSDATCAVSFAIEDTGVGIPADKLPLIFERFSQADSSVTRKFGGTGLGLAISSKLVTLMGGTLEVKSEEGQGSRFFFTIPLGRAKDEGFRPRDAVIDLRGVGVLVVDDNATNRMIVNRMLTPWGASVTEAFDAKDAMKELRRRMRAGSASYDLIILDRHMPGMDGFELAEFIHNDPRLAGSKMVMMTSDSFNIDTHRVRQAGISGYLVKPVKKSALKELIMRALGIEGTPAALTPKVQSPEALPPLRLLLVEDAENNRMLMRSYLKQTPFTVDEAENGQVALDKFRTGLYDVVLMDMQMPVMDGYTATREIRQWERETGAKPTPVLALTAHVFKDDLEQSLAAGCNAHLTKPIRKGALLEAILAHVAKGA